MVNVVTIWVLDSWHSICKCNDFDMEVKFIAFNFHVLVQLALSWTGFADLVRNGRFDCFFSKLSSVTLDTVWLFPPVWAVNSVSFLANVSVVQDLVSVDYLILQSINQWKLLLFTQYTCLWNETRWKKNIAAGVPKQVRKKILPFPISLDQNIQLFVRWVAIWFWILRFKCYFF